MVSSMRGKGWASFLVTSLTFLKSMQKLVVPSFLCTSTIGEAQGPLAGSITPCSNMLSSSSWTC